MKKFIEKYEEMMENIEVFWEGYIIEAIGVICGIVVAILYFNSVDTKPATQEDFQILEEIAIDIQQDRNVLKGVDFTLKSEQEKNYLSIQNDECMIKAEYNEDFELISIEHVDFCRSYLETWVVVILFGISVASLVPCFIVSILQLIQWLSGLLEAVRKKKK